MIFDEFKSLALNSPYIERKCIYRVDIHRHIQSLEEIKNVTNFEVKLSQSFMCVDMPSFQHLIHKLAYKMCYNQNLYALYVYELPINEDVLFNQYQRLWVYDRKGDLNTQSVCETILHELHFSSAKFRGRDPDSIRFKQGDVVDVYDREKNRVRRGVVVKQPPTIEKCWEMRKEVEKACIAEGVDAENTDDNYWLYSIDDCYWVAYEADSKLSYPHTTDVFAPMYPVSDEQSLHFGEIYRFAVEKYHNRINADKIAEHKALKRIRQIQRLVDLI